LPLSTAGAIAVAPDGKHIYVIGTDFIDNFISVVDTTAKTVTAIISLGTSPTGMVVTPNGKKIYVADGNSVSVIDSGNNKVVATLPVAGNGIAVTPDGTRVYVGNSVIDTVTDQVVATLPVSASWFIIPPPQGTPFLAFNTKLAIEFGNGGLQQDSFDLRTSFVLSSTASNGIHPDTEPVKLQVGPFTTVIPAGSFKKQGANYAYEGTINGVKLGAKIVPTGTLRYNFYVTAKDLNLMGIPHLAQVSLSIGDDAGLATVTPRVERHGVIRDTASQGLSGI
jgi:YVTN family beta-propeller protein